MFRYYAFFLPAIVLYSSYFIWSRDHGDLAFVYATLSFIFVGIPLLDVVISRWFQNKEHDIGHPLNELLIVLFSLPLQID